MELYVIRHAIAADAEPGQDDADRALTDEGRARFKDVVRGLRALGVRFERVLHSPWKRAAQTAKLLSSLADGPLEPSPLLANAPGPALIKQLSRHVEEGPLAVVGHQPWLTELVALLAFGDAALGESIELKKGGVIWLEGEASSGRMKLRGHLTPKALRTLR